MKSTNEVKASVDAAIAKHNLDGLLTPEGAAKLKSKGFLPFSDRESVTVFAEVALLMKDRLTALNHRNTELVLSVAACLAAYALDHTVSSQQSRLYAQLLATLGEMTKTSVVPDSDNPS